MRALLFWVLCFVASMARVQAQITVRSGTSADAAGITAVRDQFRSDLGGGTTAGANGSFGGLRREINWDGVPAVFAAPNNLPANFFNVNSPRGIVLSTPGIGFQVSGATSDAGAGQPAPARFGNLNPGYSSIFQSFSAQRLLTPLGSYIFDVNFFEPGTNTRAEVKGFGLILTDVDGASTTSLQFFDANNISLGVFAASPFGGGFTFLGGFVGVNQTRIARVRVTLGNTPIGPNDNNGSSDIVVADDFVYAEPSAISIFADGFE